MALIKCNECGKDISDTAKVCINCGAKTEKTKTTNKNIKIISIVSIAIILIIITIVLIYINNPANKNIIVLNSYKKQSKKIINSYFENTITIDDAISKINSLKKQVEADYNENNSSQYFNLTVQLSSADWELTKLKNNYGSITELKKIIKDL